VGDARVARGWKEVYVIDVVCCVDSRVVVEVVTLVLAAQDDSLLLLPFPLRSPPLSRNWTALEGRRLWVLLLLLSSRVSVKCARLKER
jgi:hypothetical protein